MSVTGDSQFFPWVPPTATVPPMPPIPKVYPQRNFTLDEIRSIIQNEIRHTDLVQKEIEAYEVDIDEAQLKTIVREIIREEINDMVDTRIRQALAKLSRLITQV